METIKCSIREMVEFVSRSGHIITQINANNRAVEGTRIHQMIQAGQSKDYQSEVAIHYLFDYQEFHFELQGRMDGLIIENEKVCIDEIKSVTYLLDDLEMDNVDKHHFYQVICYAYIYSSQHSLNEIDVQLTYYDVKNKDKKILREHYTIEEVSTIFFELIDKFIQFLRLYYDFKAKRDVSLSHLKFPYNDFRDGQKEMMNAVYISIKNKHKLFVHAATGLGKTLGTLFPALRAMQHHHTNKIMYLTAKAITRNVAKESLDLLVNNGLMIRATILTAKDQMCFLEKRNCHPDYCPYAKNHYDRVNEALLDILSQDYIYDKENIQEFAKKHTVCPFEFSLDLFLFSDLSILDYNYAFDPRVNLQRANNANYKLTMLVDEAHNLVDRSRQMYSKELYHHQIQTVKEYMLDKSKAVYKTLVALDEAMIDMQNAIDQKGYQVDYLPPVDFASKVEVFVWAMQKYLSKENNHEDIILDLYFEAMAFMKIFELYRESYVTYTYETNQDFMIKIYCLDPSSLLKEYYQQTQSVIFFSATLLPIQYFYRILGGEENDYKLYYESPFKSERRLVLIGDDVQAKYKTRALSYPRVCDYIYQLAKSKVGNYLVFFSSYDYLYQVYSRFDHKDVYTHKQFENMSKQQKNDFLELFKEVKDQSQVFFAVLGGMFSEGIDFKGEQLIGTIIVGVGLPQLNLERDLIKAYFKEEGYDYAYKYPGMNKVLQASGRVIRSNEDYGVILLLDERYGQKEYIKMYPAEWKHIQRTSNLMISEQLSNFWQNFSES